MRSIAFALLLTTGVLGITEAAAAQAYPSRPVAVVVPYAAGGGADAVARILAQAMGASLGKPAIVENAPGAAGNVGVGRVARAAADGYTIVEGNWSTHVANGAIYQLPYDVQKDFAPIALVAKSPLLVAARKDFPANTLHELIAWLKANPGKATAGTNGPGSIMHVAGLLFQRQTSTRFEFVPYRGAGAIVTDMLGGRIDMTISLPPDLLSQARAGAIKLYAVTGKNRLTVAPNIPTVDEAGLPGFYASAWFGLWAPKNTAVGIVTKLNAAVIAALADPAVRAKLAALGLDVPPSDQQTPQQLGAFQQAEIANWWPIIKQAGIKP